MYMCHAYDLLNIQNSQEIANNNIARQTFNQ